MSDAPPPPYSERPEALNSSPPNPEQPVASSSRSSNTSPMFHVGLRAIHAPLVEIRHLRLHLSLLYALQGLRTRVESANEPSWPPLASSLGGEQRWTWFVNLAVERFQRWLEKLSPPSRSNTLAKFVRNDMPPIDVWMVLHAYLLNPQSFAEDCSRIRSLGSLTALVSAVPDLFLEAFNTISDVILWKPHAASRANWVAKTGLPFDPLECAAILLHQDIACPQCKAVAGVPYLTPSGTGYAEPNFSYTCTSCSFDITREKLAISKLTTDLTAHLLHESQTGSADMQLYLPCTLRTEYGDDTIRATGIKQDLLNLKPISQFNSRKWKQNQGASLAMAESLEWKFSEIKKAWSQLQKPKIAAKILGAYYNQRPFSVELIGAVLRQGSFITKMHDLGWTAPTYFEKHEDALALHHAVMRYHAFLDLMSSSQHALVVPTLDIDLVWHTHQLAGSRYQKDCKTNVGRYIDHDDKVEQFYLSNAFDATCRAWEKRYGLPYTQCGCPLPGNTIGQKLARLVSHVGSRHYPLSRLAPPANQPEALAASHPSDHPAVAVLGLASNAAAKAQRESKAARRREREATRARRGEISPEEFERGAAHAPAFLVPVPLVPASAMAPLNPAGQVVCADGSTGSFAGCATDSGAACITGTVGMNEGYVGSVDTPWSIM